MRHSEVLPKTMTEQQQVSDSVTKHKHWQAQTARHYCSKENNSRVLDKTIMEAMITVKKSTHNDEPTQIPISLNQRQIIQWHRIPKHSFMTNIPTSFSSFAMITKNVQDKKLLLRGCNKSRYNQTYPIPFTRSMHRLMLNMGRQTLIHLLLACLLLTATRWHHSTVTVQATDSGKLLFFFCSNYTTFRQDMSILPTVSN